MLYPLSYEGGGTLNLVGGAWRRRLTAAPWNFVGAAFELFSGA